jgi:hypothetical protein
MARSGRVATLEEAKAQFQKSWNAWKAWANLEVPYDEGCTAATLPSGRTEFVLDKASTASQCSMTLRGATLSAWSS